MTTIFDNHANDIEYFDIHKSKSQARKNPKINIEDLTDTELLIKHAEVSVNFNQMSELYSKTKSKETLEKLEKLSSFKTALRIHMKRREIETYEKVKSLATGLGYKLDKLKRQSKDFKLISDLRGQVGKYKNLYEGQLKKNTETYQTEKTKRHELSSSRALLIHVEFKNLIYQELGEQEYSRLISKACEIVDSQRGVENE